MRIRDLKRPMLGTELASPTRRLILQPKSVNSAAVPRLSWHLLRVGKPVRLLDAALRGADIGPRGELNTTSICGTNKEQEEL